MAAKEGLRSSGEPAGSPRKAWYQNQEEAEWGDQGPEAWWSMTILSEASSWTRWLGEDHEATAQQSQLLLTVALGTDTSPLEREMKGKERWKIMNWLSLNSEFTMFKYGITELP